MVLEVSSHSDIFKILNILYAHILHVARFIIYEITFWRSSELEIK